MVADAAAKSIRKRGFMLIAFTVGLVTTLGVCGLAVDVGRMYVARSEAQSFADVAALNAVKSLALYPSGFTASADAAAQAPVKWHFGTTAFGNATTTFGTGVADTFVASPPGVGKVASDYRFARVTTQFSLPMTLIAPLVGSTATVAASAMAGQELITQVPGGEFPFSPYSRKNAAPDNAGDPFGFKVGNKYTLRWAPPGDKTNCGTDEGNVGQNGDFRGYCCTGGQSVPSIRDVLAGGGTVPMSVGDSFGQYEVSGQKATIDIDDFVDLDTDRNSATYSAYRQNTTNPGNGMRIVMTPVHDGGTVVGFAAFFLAPHGQNGGKNVCAEYIGQLVKGVPGMPPGSGSGVYRMRLYE